MSRAPDRLLDADLPGLGDLRTTLTLSSSVLRRRPAELGAQICGRLDPRSSATAHTLTAAVAESDRPSLRPVYPTLHGPSSQLVSLLTGTRFRLWPTGFSADGRAVFGTEDDTTLRLWDLRSGSEIAVMAGHTEPPYAAVLADRGVVISGGPDGLVLAWDLSDGSKTELLATRAAPVVVVEALEDVVSVQLDSGKWLAWQIAPDGVITAVREPQGLLPDDFSTGMVTADGRIRVAGTGDTWAREKDNIAWGTIEITDTVRGETRNHIGYFDRGVDGASISPDGRFCWGSSSSTGTIVWSLHGNRPTGTVAVFRHGTDELWTTPDGLAVTRRGSDLEVWDLNASRARLGHSRRVTDVAIAPGARVAVSLAQSEGERLWVWDLDGAHPPRSLWHDFAEATAVAVAPDASEAIIGMDGGRLRTQELTDDGWDTGPADPIDRAPVAREIWEPTTEIRPIGDGRYEAVTGIRDPMRTRKPLDIPFDTAFDGAVVSVSRAGATATFTADAPIATWTARDDRLVIGDAAGAVHVLKVELPKQAPRLPGAPEAPADAIIHITVDRTTGEVVTGGIEGTIAVWTGWPLEPVRMLTPHQAGVVLLAADQGVIASADAGGLVVVADGERRLSRRLSELPTAIAVTGTGRVAAIGDSSGTVRIWDLDDDSVRLAEGYHEGSVNSVALSDDGRFVYTGGEDGRVRRLEVATGKSVSQKLRDAAIAAVARLDDGSILFVTDQGAIWHYSDPREKAEKLVTGWTGLMSFAAVPGGARVVIRAGERSRIWHYPSTVAAYVEDVWHLAYPGHERLIVVEPGARRPVLVDYP